MCFLYGNNCSRYEREVFIFNLLVSQNELPETQTMLRQTRRKRHLISSPPPKMAFFGGGGGGGFFWNIFMNFWVWDTKKILERLWGKADVLK